MDRFRLIPTVFFATALLMAGCGGGGDASTEDATQEAPAAEEPAVSEDAALAMEIGPISEPLDLGAYDAALAAEGQTAFETRCVACHRMDEVFIGPALEGVLDRRSPVYVMNMVMNPEGMLERHPEAQAMLAEYNNVPMVGMGIEEPEARAILEYLRGGE